MQGEKQQHQKQETLAAAGSVDRVGHCRGHAASSDEDCKNHHRHEDYLACNKYKTQNEKSDNHNFRRIVFFGGGWGEGLKQHMNTHYCIA